MTSADTYNRSDSSSRIVLLDILRALALLAIVLVHAHDHFNCYVYPAESPSWLSDLGAAAGWINANLLTGKAFMLFAFLFGVSFFIQIDRSQARGVDYRWRFLRRMVLLGVIGLLHTIFYDGDILTIFAVQGMLLVPFFRVRTGYILAAALFCLMCLPALTALTKYMTDSPYLFSYGWENKGGYRNGIFLNAGFLQVAEWNFLYGQTSKWKYIVESGRIGQTFGLFLLGLYAGKKRIFENSQSNRLLFKRMLAISLPLCVILSTTFPAMEEYSPLRVCANLLFLASLVALATLAFPLFATSQLSRLAQLLAPVGKTTLTCYISQSLFFTFLFYGWGLQMAPRIGYAGSMIIAFVFFIAQAYAASWWLSRYRYGPVEWLWRSATNSSLQPPRLL